MRIDKARVIIFDEEKFKHIIFNPTVLKSNMSVVFARDQREEMKRKISKIDKLMKQTRYDLNESQLINIETRKNNMEAYNYDDTKMLTFKRSDNKFVTMQWDQANIVFENMILNELIVNYEKVNFETKIERNKEAGYNSIKANIILDNESVKLSKKISSDAYETVLVPTFIRLLNEKRLSDSSNMVHNLCVSQTPYGSRSADLPSSVIKKEFFSQKADVENQFGDLSMPIITYDRQMDPSEDIYAGSYWLYIEQEKKKKFKKFGILYSAKLFSANSIKLEVPCWEYLSKNNRSTTKSQSITLRRLIIRNIHYLNHLKLFSIYMYYQSKGALGLFFYHLFRNAIECVQINPLRGMFITI